MDRFVDLNEVSFYGRHFITTAAAYTDLDPIVETLLREHSGLMDRWDALWTRAQNTGGIGMSGREQSRLAQEIGERLDALYDELLEAHETIVFDFTCFFPTRRKRDNGTTFSDRLTALQRCLTGLELFPDVPNAARWRDELLDLHTRFTTTLKLEGHGAMRRLVSSELLDARNRWARHYRACRLILHGLLIRAGREIELLFIFPDLQVSAPGKRPEAAVAEAEEVPTRATGRLPS